MIELDGDVDYFSRLPPSVVSFVLLGHGDELGRIEAAFLTRPEAVPLERRDIAKALALLARSIMDDTIEIDREADLT